MRKQLITLCTLLLLSSASYANWFQDIINTITKQSGITNGLLNNELSIQQDILESQKSIDSLMNQMNKHMTSHSGYGSYGFKDYQSYGVDGGDWMTVMRMAEHGQGEGALGGMVGKVSKDFPVDAQMYNRVVTDTNSQRYYAMKSGTVLAARAASQLDYNKIQDQIAYQQMLMKQIESTRDLKGAMDLSNRIQVEGNLIYLEILRQAALVNQQQAVTEQAQVLGAYSNARFLNKLRSQP